MLVIFNFILLYSSVAYASDSDSLITKIAIQVSTSEELFPVISKVLNEEDSKLTLPETIMWSITNNNDIPLKISVVSEMPEWTPPGIATLVLAAGESKIIEQTPFGSRLLENRSFIPAILNLKVKLGTEIIFETTRNINIHPADDMLWSYHNLWDCESLIAAWVTPNDPVVEKILSIAKEKMPGRQFSEGYKFADVQKEAKEIFNAVRKYGVSYVSSDLTFGEMGSAQRVRLPSVSLIEKAANCIDGTVLLASIFENIGWNL